MTAALDLASAAALALAPRAVGRDLGRLAREGLVRVELEPGAMPASELAGLERLALDRRPAPAGRTVLLVPRSALEERSPSEPWARLALGAFDAAASPPPAPRLVGVINATPDSFSDGGLASTPELAVERGRALVEAGACMLDVGGESTRPGAAPVDPDEERARVVDVVAGLVEAGLGPVSIDTRRASVAEAALDAGAELVNDVEAGTRDPHMLGLVAERGVGYVAMHMQGEPATMQGDPRYTDVVGEVTEFLRSRMAACVAAGIDPERVLLDPGVGFGKSLEHNLELLRCLGELRSLGRPLFVGVSRKRFIGTLTEEPVPARRAFGTAAALSMCIEAGAEFLRVHDVAEMRAAAAVASAIREGARP